MPDGSTINVKGLSALRKVLAEAPAELAAVMQVGLAESAEIVNTAAHGFIRSKGIEGGPRSTGRLELLTKATKPTKTGRVFVRSSARRLTGKNAPYSYPSVIEFARGGQRGFLYPALEVSSGAVESRLERAITELGNHVNHA